jgi:hypothetical protein
MVIGPLENYTRITRMWDWSLRVRQKRREWTSLNLIPTSNSTTKLAFPIASHHTTPHHTTPHNKCTFNVYIYIYIYIYIPPSICNIVL